MTVADEFSRRVELWNQISGIATNVEPGVLRSARIYGGAQGIWIDKAVTGPLSADGQGIAVSILHTGHHYPDDLQEDGLIYHYPTTNRSTARDDGEIQATKNAGALALPMFVILPGKQTATKRSVRLGWVVDFDDENRQFLILFGDRKPEYQVAPDKDMPFALTGGPTLKTTTAKVRPEQQRFRFQVLAKYGCKCAVCSITHPNLIKAAHICGKAHHGSDDWRNGLPFCSTHHDALMRISSQSTQKRSPSRQCPTSLRQVLVSRKIRCRRLVKSQIGKHYCGVSLRRRSSGPQRRKLTTDQTPCRVEQ